MLGYENMEIEPYIDSLIDSLIEETIGLANPVGGFVIKELQQHDRSSGTVVAEETEFHVGKVIANQLKKAESLAFFVCTLGNEAELKYEKYFSTDHSLEGYIMNLAASEAADSLAENIHQRIRELASENSLHITNRFSPGYCNWNVAEQFKLFSLLPDNNIGITLTNSALMKPIKSVSGVIGIGADAVYKSYSCAQCTDEYCLYRNKR